MEFSIDNSSPSNIQVQLPSKNGYLTKRSISSLDAFANWKERFFILSNGVLSYYKPNTTSRFFGTSKDNELAHLKGDITLTGDSIVQKTFIDERINCFEVSTPDKKLFAQASSETEMEDWVRAIQQHINRMRNYQNQGKKVTLNSPYKKTQRSKSETIPALTPRDSADLYMLNTPFSGGDMTYEKPSSLETNDMAKQVLSMQSDNPKDIYIRQLLEEIKSLRAKIVEKDKELFMYRTNSVMSPKTAPYDNNDYDAEAKFNVATPGSKRRNSRGTRAPRRMQEPSALTLDLRGLRRKQLQLFDSAENSHISTLIALLNEGVVDINGKGIDDYTALHLAAQNNHPDVIEILVSRGAMIHARTRERHTALHIASHNGHYKSAEVLLRLGADPNITDALGNGAIHLAAENGFINIVKLLINNGAKKDVSNSSGSLPLHLAPIGHPIRVLLDPENKTKSLLGTISKGDEVSNGTGTPSANTASSAATSRSTSASDSKTEDSNDDTVNLAFTSKYQTELALGPCDFEFIRVLGRGAFAKVYLVRGKGKNSNSFYALKAYNKQAIIQKNQARYIYTEKQALQACSNHPYIVTLHYAFQSNDRLFLVMDYCGGGDLLSALTRHKRFKESEARIYIGEIILAVSHLHSKNIVFRDLKPENVVLDMEGHCMLTDFGISKEGIEDHSSATTFCGSPMYLAPEMLSRSGHGFPLDWYSVGALFYELVTGLPPYYTNDKKQLFQSILKGPLLIPDYLSQHARSLCQALLQRDPSSRLGSGPNGVQDIMSHPFFASLDWKALYERRIPPPYKPTISYLADGTPDHSNFPESFTGQVITDAEKGLGNKGSIGNTTRNGNDNTKNNGGNRKSKVFAEFDFVPQVKLDDEARQFEKLALYRGKKERTDGKNSDSSDKKHSEKRDEKSDKKSSNRRSESSSSSVPNENGKSQATSNKQKYQGPTLSPLTEFSL